MIEAVQIVRDVVIILSLVIITVMVVLMGRVVLALARRAEDLQVIIVDMVTGVMNPLKGVLHALARKGRT